MVKVRIELCTSCTTKLADLRNAHGQKAMGEAAGAVIAACRQCAHQLPDELRYGFQTGAATTAMKQDPEPMQEVGRFILNV
jgi:hypothetical protein